MLLGWKYISGQYTATLVIPIQDLHCSRSIGNLQPGMREGDGKVSLVQSCALQLARLAPDKEVLEAPL